MNAKTILILLAIAVVLFFAGRFTAPRPRKDYKVEMDSIKLAYKVIDQQLKQNKDSIDFYKKKALDAYQQAEKAQKIKIIYQAQYEKDTARYHRLSVHARDSIIRAIFLR